MFFPNPYLNQHRPTSAPDVEMGGVPAGTPAGHAGPRDAYDGDRDHTGATREAGAGSFAPGTNPDASALGPRRLFTSALSRDVMLGGAAGLLTGAWASGIYAVVKSRDWPQAVRDAYDAIDPAYYGNVSRVGTPSPAAVAAMMVVLPLAGAAIAAAIDTTRFHLGHNNSETTQPLPAQRAPFWKPRMGLQLAAAAGLGLVAGGLGAAASMIQYGRRQFMVVTGCLADNGETPKFYQDCAASAAGPSDNVDNVVALVGPVPYAAIACSLLLVPLAAAAIELGRHALKHDYRKRESQTA